MATQSVTPSFKQHQNGNRDIFGSLHERIDRVFDDFTRGFHLPSSMLQTDFGALKLLPSLDMSEDEGMLIVSVELPGVEESDVDVTLSEDILTVKGEKKSEIDDKQKDYHVVERKYGSFARSIRLPSGIDPDEVKAKFDKGVLTVTMPKPEELQQKVRKIDIDG